MKKFITAIIAILYISISSGVVIDVHHCMNKLASVKIQYHVDDTCGNCGMKIKDGCCTHELKIVKLSDEHKYDAAATLPFNVEAAVVHTYVIPEINFAPGNTQVVTRVNGPPLLSAPEIYLKNCVFRI